MTNGTDSDSVPVADPTPDGDSDTRWPTWSDISRLHHIPSASGETEPAEQPDRAEGSDPSAAAPAPVAAVPEPRRPESAPVPTEHPSTADPAHTRADDIDAAGQPATLAEPVSPAAPGSVRGAESASATEEEPATDGTPAELGTPVPDDATPHAETRTETEVVDDSDVDAAPVAETTAPRHPDEGAPQVAASPAVQGEPAADGAAVDGSAGSAPATAPSADVADDAAAPAAVDDAAGAPAADEAEGATAAVPAADAAVADPVGSVAPVTDGAAPTVVDGPSEGPTGVSSVGAAQTGEPRADDEPRANTEADAEPVDDHPSAAEPGARPTPALEPDTAPAAVGQQPARPAADELPTTVLENAVPPQPPAPTGDPVRTSAFPATSAGVSASPRIDGGAIPVAVREPSVLDEFEPDDGRRRWPRQLAVVLGVVVVLVGAYAGASYALGHRVPRGASVAGVDIGGLTQAAAVDRLTDRLGPATTGSLTVKAGDQQSQLDPRQAGLTFDAAATVRRLVGVDLLQPVRLWNQVVGVGAQPAVTAVDAAALHTSVQQLADSLQVDPVNGAIVFVDGAAHATPAQDGTDLDVAGAEKVIRDGWLVGARPLVLPTTTVAPDVTQAETDAALSEVAKRVAGAPVTVAVADRTVSLPASTLVANASFVAQDGKLVLQMNGPALVTQVLAQTPGLATAAADAHFEFQNDAPVLVPGTPGTTIDPAALAAAVATAASSADNRTATVSLVPSDPSQSTAALQALGVKEIVSEFATPLTSEPHRTVNITIGASKINGVLVKPGDTFSLGEALSPIDPAHGYIDAGAIVDGDHVQALGGGLSQVSTTTYNAAFFAGFEDVAHTPHSEWFSRYPEGREATIFYPSLDMKWKNNTTYGALIQSWVAGNQVHVRIWGTKYWTVTSTTSPRSRVHAPTTVYSQSPTCTAQSAGNPGFTVTVTRQLALNGEVKQTTSRTTTYKAQDTIICGPAPTGTPSPTQ